MYFIGFDKNGVPNFIENPQTLILRNKKETLGLINLLKDVKLTIIGVDEL